MLIKKAIGDFCANEGCENIPHYHISEDYVDIKVYVCENCLPSAAKWVDQMVVEKDAYEAWEYQMQIEIGIAEFYYWQDRMQQYLPVNKGFRFG